MQLTCIMSIAYHMQMTPRWGCHRHGFTGDVIMSCHVIGLRYGIHCQVSICIDNVRCSVMVGCRVKGKSVEECESVMATVLVEDGFYH